MHTFRFIYVAGLYSTLLCTLSLSMAILTSYALSPFHSYALPPTQNPACKNINKLEYRSSVDFWNTLNQDCPNNYKVINNLALAYEQKKQFTQALSYYQQAIQLEQTNPVAYAGLGDVQEQLNQPQQALIAYCKFFEDLNHPYWKSLYSNDRQITTKIQYRTKVYDLVNQGFTIPVDCKVPRTRGISLTRAFKKVVRKTKKVIRDGQTAVRKKQNAVRKGKDILTQKGRKQPKVRHRSRTKYPSQNKSNTHENTSYKKSTKHNLEILFDLNQSSIKPLTDPMLEDASIFLKAEYKKDQSKRFTLVGHTDQRGVDHRNYALSNERALAVRSRLEAMGVKKGWLAIYGMGARHLKSSRTTEAAHAQNRRVELLLDFNP
jgi:outer membrane protein OmpA-like peptidoglycan-associated protein